jgi:AcrR family transcriptional regulator
MARDAGSRSGRSSVSPKVAPSRTAREPRRLGRPTNADGEDTRRHILDIARECFAEYGYAATTNRTLADKTGFTSAAIYHHFGRKNDLMIAVYKATENETYTRMRASIEGKQGLVEKAQAVFDVTHKTLVKDRAQAVFMFVARKEALRHPELAEIADDRMFADLFADIVRQAVIDGEVEESDARYIRGVLMVIAAGLASLGTEISASGHRVATEGCKRLVAGDLLVPKPAPSAKRKRSAV